MSKPWRPDDDVVRARFGGGRRLRSLDAAPGLAVPPSTLRPSSGHASLRTGIRRIRRLPDGAKAGLALFAAACLGAAIGLYEVAGPSDVFERDPTIDWNAVDEAARR